MNARFFTPLRPVALVAAVALLTPLHAVAQSKWWQSERFQRELELSTEQVERIEEVFRTALPELREQKKTLDRAETELARLIDTTADEASVMEQVDRVEQVRSDLSKTRTRMLLRMRRVLTADQRLKFAEIHEEWSRNRKRQSRHE